MTLSASAQSRLEAAYKRGASGKAAAAEARCHPGTALRYFDGFRARKLERAPRHVESRRWASPPYDGPEWIGKPA